jgi:hypothetical protein
MELLEIQLIFTIQLNLKEAAALCGVRIRASSSELCLRTGLLHYYGKFRFTLLIWLTLKLQHDFQGGHKYILSDFEANPTVAGDILAEVAAIELSEKIVPNETASVELHRKNFDNQDWLELKQHGWSPEQLSPGHIVFKKQIRHPA